MKQLLTALLLLAAFATLRAADPMLTSYSASQCEGSLTPYPTDINPAVYPDSLTPVFIIMWADTALAIRPRLSTA